MKHVCVDKPITFSGITLIPVVHIGIQNNNIEMGHFFSGYKEPLAIIVCDKKGVRAFDINSSEIAISTLLQKIPDLDTILIPYRSASI